MSGDLLKPVPGGGYSFYCPGCRATHTFGPGWMVTGMADRPTVEGSILHIGFAFGEDGASRELPRCHCTIEGGKIRYCSDCEHLLAGSVVDLQPQD